MKVQKIPGNKKKTLFVYLPKEVVQRLGLVKGTVLSWYITNRESTLVIRKYRKGASLEW